MAFTGKKQPMAQMQQQGGMGPSPGFMSALQSKFGGGRGPDPNYIAASNLMNQTEGGGMFAGMKNMFGGQKDPYQRANDMGYSIQAPAEGGQIGPVGPPMMEPPPQPMMPPQSQGNAFGRMGQRPPQMGMMGRMKNAMMQRQQQPPMQPQRRPMGMGNRGIGPSMM